MVEDVLKRTSENHATSHSHEPCTSSFNFVEWKDSLQGSQKIVDGVQYRYNKIIDFVSKGYFEFVNFHLIFGGRSLSAQASQVQRFPGGSSLLLHSTNKLFGGLQLFH